MTLIIIIITPVFALHVHAMGRIIALCTGFIVAGTFPRLKGGACAAFSCSHFEKNANKLIKKSKIQKCNELSLGREHWC